MTIFWIETTGTIRVAYAVEAENLTHEEVQERVNQGTLNEIGQVWKGEIVNSINVVSPEEYLIDFDGIAPEAAKLSIEEKFDAIIPLNEEVHLESE